MQINDTWEIEDAVSGLRLKVIPGTKQDRLHVESLTGGTAADDHPKMNRDFWFTKDGTFDGTGSVVEDMPNPAVTVPPLVADKVDELVGRPNDLSETKTGD